MYYTYLLGGKIMSSIIKQKVGDKIYLYESVSYRNEYGFPRNKRKTIGKIDPASGKPTYKPEYLERMKAEGRPIEIIQVDSSFAVGDIQHSTVKDFGAFYLFEMLAEQMGLLSVLRKSLPRCSEEIFNLAAYLISTGDPFTYCEDWLASTEAFPVGPMSSQRISELLAGITNEERDDFYHLWCSLRSEREYLALDITSTSSYSELIDSVEWGYNRDGENLQQINICLLMGYQSRYPIYQTVYGGSLKDVTTLQTTIQSFRALAGEKPMIAVMDKGFFSTRNVNTMLSEKQHVDFIIAVPFTNKFARGLVKSERKDIDTLSNTIVYGKESLRAVTKLRRWNGDNKVYSHVYYNARKAQMIREDLYAHVATLKEEAISQPEKYVDNSEYMKYLIIRRSEKDSSGYTVNLREDVVEAELETAGWMIIISNYITDAKEAIKIYREKDIVEKGFMRLKNSLDLGRIRVHSERSMQNKVFIGFISLILLSSIHNIMVDKKLYSKMSMKKLIITLSKLRLQIIKGVRILFPVTKEQRGIYEAFSIQQPM
jgi:transposase